MRILIVISCLSFVAACDKSETQPEPTAVEAPAAEVQPTATAQVDPNVHNVACACSLAEGKACGNMIEVDGRYLPLEGETGLEEMAFCGKEGIKAKVEGKVDGEKFVATSVQLIEPAAK